MNLFQLNEGEIYCFFAVFIRLSILIAILPFLGDQLVPAPVKALLSLAFAIMIFPVLVQKGHVKPDNALLWSRSAGGIALVVFSEALVALITGFIARVTFDAIQIGGNLAGNLMGLATANQFDPHQESQSPIIAQTLAAIAMLLFLAMDGHHMMLRAAVDSYRLISMGHIRIDTDLSQRIIALSADMIRVGFQLAAPMALSFFAVSIAYGIFSKAIPQVNILVLSFSISAVVGFAVLMLGMNEFGSVVAGLYDNMGDEMGATMALMGKK